MDIISARHHVHKKRFGTVAVSLSSASFNGDNDRGDGPRIARTKKDMNSAGRVRYEWPEGTPSANNTRYIKIEQREQGGTKAWRGLEISSVKVYGARC